MACDHDPGEHVQVLAATRRRAGPQRLVEAADLLERASGKREARASTEDAGGVRVQRGLVTVLGQVEDPALALGAPALAQVEVELSRAVEFGGRDQPGHAGNAWRRVEAAGDAV